MSNDVLRERAVALTARLHTLVDELTAPLSAEHADRLQCKRGCHGCCIDGLTVFEVEAEVIRRAVGDSLRGESPAAHPATWCAFLSHEGACRIYAARPYVCRTQGLPLRWIELDESANAPVELRDICPLNELEAAPLSSLDARACWAIGPFETKLAELQRAYDPDAPEARVPLRALFEELAAT